MFDLIQLYLYQLINRFRRDEEGASLAEYGLLLALIALVCIAAVTVLGTKVSSVFSTIANSL
jgi:pilus assembly protein Flp/PilA